jgi:hypothetical protein
MSTRLVWLLLTSSPTAVSRWIKVRATTCIWSVLHHWPLGPDSFWARVSLTWQETKYCDGVLFGKWAVAASPETVPLGAAVSSISSDPFWFGELINVHESQKLRSILQKRSEIHPVSTTKVEVYKNLHETVQWYILDKYNDNNYVINAYILERR